MSIANIILSPFNLLFLILLVGFAIGRIRIRKITLGIAGVLFAAILVGALIKIFLPNEHTTVLATTETTMKTFKTLGSSLFVSVIGLQAGFSLKNNSKGSVMAMIAGALMSLTGVTVMLLISVLDRSISDSTLLGVLCGALTSTPGLSGVCELLGNDANAAVIGYGCSYFGGVLLAVILSQVFVRDREKAVTLSQEGNKNSSKTYSELILICVSALLGNLFGEIFKSCFGITIGSTAFTLLFSLLIGLIVKNSNTKAIPSSASLSIFKILGLALFFVGTGFATGIQSVSFDIKTVLYGILITLTSITCGILASKSLFSRFTLDTGFVIAGGMTSSPAYGAIADYAREESSSHFSFAYFGGLIALVIAIQIMTI